MIHVSGLKKEFRVHKKEPGFWGSLQSLFARNWTNIEALKSVDLKVESGEILGLLGANGAGKTTIVKILSGVIHPTAGQVSVLGFNPCERDPELLRQISLIMGQKAQLWWDLPAADSFELLREIYQVDKIEHRKQLTYLVETLGVENQIKVQVRRLSLGERMKMELIAALLHKPKVVFLDEPTIGLDLTAQRAIRTFIESYRQQYKPAMILTSHYMEDIESLCERVAIIKGGQFVYDGPLRDIVDKYAHERVITFVLEEGHRAQVPPWPGCEILESGEMLKIHTGRQDLTKAISTVIGKYPVRDIQIDEQDVSDVIEHMIRKGVTE